MAQTCNLPISDVRPLRADYRVGFQSILAYRVTLYLQNRTQLRSSCNFLEPLRNPKLSFGSVLHSPALGLQTQSPQTRAIRRAEGSSNCRSRKPFSRKQPSPHSHLPVSSFKRDTPEEARGVREHPAPHLGLKASRAPGLAGSPRLPRP